MKNKTNKRKRLVLKTKENSDEMQFASIIQFSGNFWGKEGRLNLKKTGHCSEGAWLKILSSQDNQHSGSSVKPGNCGVFREGDNRERRNSCMLRETTGLKRQRRYRRKQRVQKKRSDEQRDLINPAHEADITECTQQFLLKLLKPVWKFQGRKGVKEKQSWDSKMLVTQVAQKTDGQNI